MIDFAALKAPFPPEKISWRVGSVTKDGIKAMALAYIDARDVMNRLDDVCGPNGWQCRYPHAGGKTVCEIGLFVPLFPDSTSGDAWIWKADGAGDSDIEADKGALSDAFKRAAVRWGIGRYLYDLSAPWVAIDQFKKIVPHELERLASLLPNALPGLTVQGMTGHAKEPAKFWSKGSLTIPLKNSLVAEVAKTGGVWTDEANKWWIGEFKRAIEKAPTRELLAKLQTDNAHILDALPAGETHMLYEALTVRATQFDQHMGVAA